jgi:hypothetical protein
MFTPDWLKRAILWSWFAVSFAFLLAGIGFLFLAANGFDRPASTIVGSFMMAMGLLIGAIGLKRRR